MLPRMSRRTLAKNCFLLGTGVLARTAVASATASPVAQTHYGKVRGVEVDSVSIFRGIPYGGPTEGAGRFLPPQKPAKWTGILDVSQTGPRCIQAPGNLFDTPIGDYFCGGRKEQLGLSHQTDSENCLVLNVLTPGLKGKRPVMVYIHGGGYTGGSGIIALAADAFPREEDVVLVSVNHRLNIFGFTYLGGINEKFADSGNAGMLDLVAALEWVRDNISGFGGDPGNVTIFGESGGGGKVSALMAMPSAKGLFGKAIIESGSSLRAGDKEQASVRAKGVLAKLGIPENRVEDLQTLAAAKLFAAGSGGGPVVDGRSIPVQTWDPAAPEISADVPLIVGTCKDEAAWNIGERDPSTFTLNEADMRSRLERSLRIPAADIEDLVAIYRKARPNASASDVFFEISSDRSTRMNAIAQAERKTRLGKAPAFMYYFAYDTPMDGGKYRAFHTAELPLVLRLVRYPNSDQVSKQLAGAWAAFARHGKPDHAGMPPWPAYAMDQRATMVFTAEDTHAENDPLREARLKYLSLPVPNGGRGRGRAG
jgi:para-nitrobenzyl esterase